VHRRCRSAFESRRANPGGGRRHCPDGFPDVCPAAKKLPARLRTAATKLFRQGRESMKKIEAIIQPHKLDEVKEALRGVGVEGVTLTDLRGHGRQKGHTETYRGQEYKVDFLPKVQLMMVVSDSAVSGVIQAISTAARTGKIGDGKIFVTPVEEVVRIRNGDQGEVAL
jgi:nitrogen regulatory protein P-II 1